MKGHDELRFPRAVILRAVVLAVFGVIVLRLAYIQLVDDRYGSMARDNFLRYEVQYPPRGEVFDRNGEYLVQSRECYDLMVIYRDLPKEGFDTLRLCDVTGISERKLERALADARKGVDMYRNDKVNVPILGLVENMAWFTPAELPENKYYIFGKEGCKQLAEELGVPLLGQIPLVQSICESGDAGAPVALDTDTVTGRAFLQLAAAVVRQVDKRNIEMAPTQVVQVKK